LRSSARARARRQVLRSLEHSQPAAARDRAVRRRRFLAALVAGAVAVPAFSRAQTQYAMRPFGTDTLAAIKSRYANRPFVLAFWSIHCAPCLDDMATWRSLRERFPEVPIVLVSTDPPAEQSAMHKALSRFPPGNVETWAFADDFVERTRYAVDRNGRGE